MFHWESYFFQVLNNDAEQRSRRKKEANNAVVRTKPDTNRDYDDDDDEDEDEDDDECVSYAVFCCCDSDSKKIPI